MEGSGGRGGGGGREILPGNWRHHLGGVLVQTRFPFIATAANHFGDLHRRRRSFTTLCHQTRSSVTVVSMAAMRYFNSASCWLVRPVMQGSYQVPQPWQVRLAQLSDPLRKSSDVRQSHCCTSVGRDAPGISTSRRYSRITMKNSTTSVARI